MTERPLPSKSDMEKIKGNVFALSLFQSSIWSDYLEPLLKKIHLDQIEVMQRATKAGQDRSAMECFGRSQAALYLLQKIPKDAGKTVEVKLDLTVTPNEKDRQRIAKELKNLKRGNQPPSKNK